MLHRAVLDHDLQAPPGRMLTLTSAWLSGGPARVSRTVVPPFLLGRLRASLRIDSFSPTSPNSKEL